MTTFIFTSASLLAGFLSTGAFGQDSNGFLQPFTLPPKGRAQSGTAFRSIGPRDAEERPLAPAEGELVSAGRAFRILNQCSRR